MWTRVAPLKRRASARCWAAEGRVTIAPTPPATRGPAPAPASCASGVAATAAPAAGLSAVQTRWLSLAEAGVSAAHRAWSDPRRGWYDARLHDRDRYPLATIWDIVPLFESIDAIAITAPTPAHLAAVRR